MISAIVAIDENYGIGYKNELLCNIKGDLKQFKTLTTNNIVVMGRKTWNSLPKKPLPNRINIVVTNNVDVLEIKDGVMYATLNFVRNFITRIESNKDIFIIGGGQIYKKLLPYCTHIHLTKMYTKFKNVDTYFPQIEDDEWELITEEDIAHHAERNINYQFCIYKRK